MALQDLQDLECSDRDNRTRSEDGKSPVLGELVVVLRRNDPAEHNGHSFMAKFREGLAKRGHERQVTGGKRAWSDNIDVFKDGLARRLFGRLE